MTREPERVLDRALPVEPQGFRCAVLATGIKPGGVPDFTVVVSDRPAAAAAVLTRSKVPGAPVLITRRHVADGVAQAVVVTSGNANVATGAQGTMDAEEIVVAVAAAAGVPVSSVLPASTGVIGRYLPMAEVRPHFAEIGPALKPGELHRAAEGIMTTDVRPKLRWTRVGDAVLVGMAKGAGMIAPDLATLLVYFFTDAEVPADRLDALLRRTSERSFNRISIDTDTSTSDTVAVLANGAAGPVDPDEFAAAFDALALGLAKDVVREGEGVTKLLEVRVTGAPDERAAERVARAIADSPLVKTAVFGADPNWGRIVMALGKCADVEAIDPDRLSLRLGGVPVYSDGRIADDAGLDAVRKHFAGADVLVEVDLGAGAAAATVWGCDLTYEYVRINGEYTT